MLNKICRICPSSAKWKYPTKKIGENSKAYTAQFGFGFEEWLNREEWLLSGYSGLEEEWRYVHIQGMRTPKNAYEGEYANILFYVKQANQPALAVAYLENAYAIGNKEATWVQQQFHEKGWMHTMYGEVQNITGNTNGLPPMLDSVEYANWNPLDTANIRFKVENLYIFNVPKLLIPEPTSFYYGKVIDWNGILPKENYVLPGLEVPLKHGNATLIEKALNRFSEEIQKRRSATGKDVIPRQAPIQNALAEQLNNFYKPLGGIVTCEDGRVDIKLVAPDKSVTFIEIKPANSARQAIRHALGQLLEYSHYPQMQKADRLVIVSDAELQADDNNYLNYLKKIYGITIGYVHWPRGTKVLPTERLKDFI